MSEQQIPAKFRITWKDGRYFVDIPNYEGGEVVRADIAERMAEALVEAAAQIVYLHGKFQRTATGEASISRIRSALSAFRSATQDTEARYD